MLAAKKMKLIPLHLDTSDPVACAEGFRARAEAAGLKVVLETNLAGVPGSIHLHLRKTGERSGVLEFTACPERAWLSVHAGRHKPWIDEAVRLLTEA